MHGHFVIKIYKFYHGDLYNIPWFQYFSMKITAWNALDVGRFGFQFSVLLTLPSCITLGKLFNFFGTQFF